MAIPEPDMRSAERKRLDEELALEPELPPPDLTLDARPHPVEDHLRQAARRPVAVMGIVENGLVRPLDSDVKLPEHARVIIVTSERV
jgi:hypothetical protein